ncbi:MAG: potassium channel protein [Proteobacteria bacterium]|nr:potassium channel protein [Pseudomonadota bacterium]
MLWERQLKIIPPLLIGITIFGVIGFMLIEGWGFLDSLYMTITTISTVGYGEVKPLTTIGRVFTIVLIVLGVGVFFFIITIIAEYIIAGHLVGAIGRRKMKQKIGAYKEHYILCGFGRVGEQVAASLVQEGVPIVIIDNDPEIIKRCEQKGYAYIEGDASDDAVLKEAGIEKAIGLVTATDSDADNVYVTLSSKSLKEDLIVVARATTEEAGHKLLKAGADRVISPYSIGGKRLASLLLRPAVVEFLDVVMHDAEEELLMEDVFVREKSRFVGNTIVEAREKCAAGANILAVKKKGAKRMLANPPAQTLIEIGDHLVALGTKAQLKELERLS